MDRDTESTLLTDKRAVAPVVGFILLFAMGIIAFASYQAFVVPNQNADVEFSHSQQIENEFSDFRSNVVNAIESRDERSTSFTLGTQYPSRLIALNPPAPAGSLSTTDSGEVSIDGVDMQDVCGVDEATTRSLVYESQYNEYLSAQSVVYENTFVGATFRDGQSFPQSQRLVQGDRLKLTLLTGSVSESRTGSVGVDINATHRSPSVEGASSVTIPSQFDSEAWENQILQNQGNIDTVEDAGDGRVEITFSEPLDVSCAVVGLNSDPEFTPPESEPDPEEPGESVSPAYDVDWASTQDDPNVDDEETDEDFKITADFDETTSVEFDAEISPEDITEAQADFSFQDPDDVGIIFDNTLDYFEGGQATLNLEGFDREGVVTLLVTSGGASDEITVEIEEEEEDAPPNELYPNEEIDTTNLAGNVEDLRDNDETEWYEADSPGADTQLIVGMDDPEAELEGEQTVQFHVRKSQDINRNPDAEFTLRQDGEQIAFLGSEEVTSADGETFTVTFDASELNDPQGEDVELVIDGVRSGGPQGDRTTVEVGYVTWEPEYEN